MAEEDPQQTNGAGWDPVRGVRDILLAPRAFYATMPARGGVAEALIFLLVLEVIAGIVKGAMYMVGGGQAPATMYVLWGVMFYPFAVALVSFAVAGILWLVWFLLGSRLPYETAYRCFAFTAAIAPVTTLLDVVPYLGWGVHILWAAVLLAIASEEVHGIPALRARITFGVLGVALLAGWGSLEHTARNYPERLAPGLEQGEAPGGGADERRREMQRQLERSQEAGPPGRQGGDQP